NWRFDISSGDCVTEPDRPVSCFAIRQADGIIWVGSRTREGTRDRGGEHDDAQARRLRGET
ncbi:MAG: hypothetical protein QGG40_15960, partial [Myxococcota bacterium]|nr:hypothetical protein [Myxococcota bacterium]